MEEKMEYRMKVIMEELEGSRKREEEWKRERRIEELDKKWMKRMSMKGGRKGIGRIGKEGKEVRGWGKKKRREDGIWRRLKSGLNMGKKEEERRKNVMVKVKRREKDVRSVIGEIFRQIGTEVRVKKVQAVRAGR